MRVVVFGSTGKTGLLVIQEALKKGYEVVAYARKPEKITLSHPQLSVVSGELDAIDAMKGALNGADAVISLLGSSATVKDTSLSDGVKNLVVAMEAMGVRKLVQVTTTISSDPKDRFHLKLNFMVSMIKVLSPKTYSEIQRLSDTVKESSLDWTLIRVPFLNDNEEISAVQVGYRGDKHLSTSLSRVQLAAFMVEVLSTENYTKQSPFVTS